eukprot:6349309-Amphidinium_carterae.1
MILIDRVKPQNHECPHRIVHQVWYKSLTCVRRWSSSCAMYLILLFDTYCVHVELLNAKASKRCAQFALPFMKVMKQSRGLKVMKQHSALLDRPCAGEEPSDRNQKLYHHHRPKSSPKRKEKRNKMTQNTKELPVHSF